MQNLRSCCVLVKLSVDDEQAEYKAKYADPSLKDLPFNLKTLARWPLLLLIKLYQLTLSRSLPPNTCRFYPTCSHYGFQAIYRYGAFKGGWMAATRIIRCNPFNQGGIDPVP